MTREPRPSSQAPGRARGLRPLRDDDEAAYGNAVEVMAAEGHGFGFGLEPGIPWGTHLRMLDERRRGLNVPGELVPATFLVAGVGGTTVARPHPPEGVTPSLNREGGHIGYCVLPAYRRRGYATEILRQSLTITRALGIDRVLIFCDDDNTGSIGVIERCGGTLDSVFSPGPSRQPLRRYLFD